ncbi:MAG: putative motility protein [Calditrichaeota bacterium]|nr:putative motility protein [Calditrichota bacterium]
MAVEQVRSDAAQLIAMRRAALEEQTARAIQRAQRNYLEIQSAAPAPINNNPPHLGKHIDIRV